MTSVARAEGVRQKGFTEQAMVLCDVEVRGPDGTGDQT